jgi:hypothetical protein
MGVLPSGRFMDLFHGLFQLITGTDGEPRLSRPDEAPGNVPDPATGRLLRVATVETQARAICPRCEVTGEGGYVSFESDLRLAYACPSCRTLVWLAGA